jgi:hypothetical protein
MIKGKNEEIYCKKQNLLRRALFPQKAQRVKTKFSPKKESLRLPLRMKLEKASHLRTFSICFQAVINKIRSIKTTSLTMLNKSTLKDRQRKINLKMLIVTKNLTMKKVNKLDGVTCNPNTMKNQNALLLLNLQISHCHSEERSCH